MPEGDFMLLERVELEERLIPEMYAIANNKSKLSKIKKKLSENEILESKTAMIFNKPEIIKQEDLRLIALLSSAIYETNKVEDVNPSKIFTPTELKEARMYSDDLAFKTHEPLFPKTFDRTEFIANSVYITSMSVQEINTLLVNGGLTYDFDTQREATYERRNDQIVQVATLNQQSVDEISHHLVEGTLVPTMLAFNAKVRSSDEGDELIYDSKKKEITITKGTILTILDGYHRCKGIQAALSVNPNLDFRFPVMLLNYSQSKAQRYLGQIAKANPISKARAKELSQASYATTVIQQLREESMLKGMISQTERLIRINKEIVTVSVLMDSIEEEFNLKTKKDALDVGDFLVKFFDYLISYHEEAFITKYNETRAVSLINFNQMFYGYIILARRLYKNNRKPKDINDIMKKIDFSKDNPIWRELGIIKKDGSTNYQYAKKSIKKYFNQLEI
ncbi:MAG: DNA sulfur modification protein DndB [Bacillaceae bacterium]